MPPITPDVDVAEYLPLFLAEAGEHLGELNLAVVRIEADPADTATVNEIFRIAHSLKGMSATMGFEGMTGAESKPLLDYLLDHGHRPEFTCRFRWDTGSIAFWDNRVCKHLAIHDAGPFRRVMRRTQIAGGPWG